MKNINNIGGVIIMHMANKKDQIGYDINEKDIDGVIRFLKINDPKNASPERAIAFLASTKLNFRKSTDKDFGDNLINLYNEFKKSL